jgi:hypothetical protein
MSTKPDEEVLTKKQIKLISKIATFILDDNQDHYVKITFKKFINNIIHKARDE